jgi:preprotein translocase subunit SecD
MRGRRAVAILLAAAATLRAGEDEQDGAEIIYEFGAGEAPAAAEVLEKRLRALGVEGVTVKPAEDGKRVVVRLAKRDRLEDVQAVAERVGHLEFRRVVKPDTAGYINRRLAFDAALKRGIDIEKARDVPADSLRPAERVVWPNGLRWYRNPHPTESPVDDWILCEIDSPGLTEAALEEVRTLRSPNGEDQWEVHFCVKADFRDKMAELTSKEDVRLAIILDGEVLCAPVVRAQLTRNGTITMSGEREARSIAAALGGGALPRKPTFIAERRIER